MSDARSAIGDSDILKKTTYSAADAKGRRQLQFKLPSGRLITSTDWLVPGEVKGKVLIAWAEAIRAEDLYDVQERDERERLARVEKRARELTSSAPMASTAHVQSPTSSEPKPGLEASSAPTSKASSTPSLPDDPKSVIEEKLTALYIEAAEADNQLSAAKTRLHEAQVAITRWEAVLAVLEPTSPSPKTLHLARTPRQQRLSRKESPNETDSSPDDSPATVDPVEG